MHDALSLFGDLADSDVAWILNAGAERRVPAGEVLIREGETPADLYLVLDGLVEVEVAEIADVKLGRLGAGELLGEISWLEGSTASATVRTLEPTQLLALSRETLERKVAEDLPFAGRLYRSFAQLLARRLRERVTSLGRMVGDVEQSSTSPVAARTPMAKALSEFKALIHQADHAALANEDTVPPTLREQVQRQFVELTAQLEQLSRAASGSGSRGARVLVTQLQQEMLPFLLLTRTAERAYSKPRGYAGDFLTIEWIYHNEEGGSGRVGPLIDRCFLDLPCSRAVRNRRTLLMKEIQRALEASEEAPCTVTSLACGPAREVFDVYQGLEVPARLESWLIDIDPQALDFVRQRKDELSLGPYMHLNRANLIYLATGRQTLDLPPQDLMYSIGLTDYFDDRFVVNLANYVYELLKPGGRVIFGNFHPRNPSRAVMEHLAEWKLVHRTEEDMHRIFMASRFQRSCTRIQFESQGINLFAECERAER